MEKELIEKIVQPYINEKYLFGSAIGQNIFLVPFPYFPL